MQLVAVIVSLVITIAAIGLVARAARQIVGVVRLGQVNPTRRGNRMARVRSVLNETLGHSRMVKWRWIGVMHYFVFIGFGALFFTLVTAYGQVFSASFALPWIGHWVV